MLNARALSTFALQAPSDGSDAAPQRPVEAYQTGEGVIVLSNRPGAPPPAAVEQAAYRADAAAPLAANAIAPAAASPTTSAVALGGPPSEPSTGSPSTALWVGLFAALLLLAGGALLVRRRRRRSKARYAALLAGSEPIGAPRDAAPGPFAPVPVAVEPRSAAPAKSAEERSSPRSAPPPSGISAPPASERQWQSQPPPRNVKDRPE